MKRFFRIAALFLVILAAGAGGWWYWTARNTAAAPSFMTVSVARGDIEQTVLATGTLRPTRLVAAGAQVSGRITALHVEVGQEVAEGDLVAEIDSVTQQNALRIAEAALAATRAQLAEKEATLTLNQRALERQEQLLARSSTTTAEYESAAAAIAITRAQIDALDAQIAQGEVAIETARANLAYTRITAPISGTVLAVVSQEGQTVNAAQSAPTIVVLGQIDRMTVRAEISEADIGRVAPGQEVWFTTLSNTGERYRSVLDVIEPAPESIRNDSAISDSGSSSSSSEAIYYTGMFEVPNPDGRLRTYMTVQVNIVLGQANNALTIPSAALGTRGNDGRYVVRVLGEDGQPETRLVAIGLDNRIMAEVLDGLSEGERVITGQTGGTASSTATGSSGTTGRAPGAGFPGAAGAATSRSGAGARQMTGF